MGRATSDGAAHVPSCGTRGYIPHTSQLLISHLLVGTCRQAALEATPALCGSYLSEDHHLRSQVELQKHHNKHCIIVVDAGPTGYTARKGELV